MKNNELQSILPDVHTMLHALENKDFNDYESKLTKVTEKAIGTLESLIDDQTLRLDPEQTVRSVQVLTKAKTDIIEAKRRLIDTCIKGEVMIKALEQPKGGNESSVLLEYLEKNNLNTDLDKKGTSPSSIFESIAKQQE